MDTATAAIVAASIGAGVALLIAFIGINARIIDRLGRLEQGFGMLRDDYQHLREDSRQWREEMREDNRQLREEMREDNRRLRDEMREDNRQLREEMREEMRESNQQLRELIRSGKRADESGNPAAGRSYGIPSSHDDDGSIQFRIPPL